MTKRKTNDKEKKATDWSIAQFLNPNLDKCKVICILFKPVIATTWKLIPFPYRIEFEKDLGKCEE